MITRRAFAPVLSLLALCTLSGCIAAAAIPVLAGGAGVGKKVLDRDQQIAARPVEPRVEVFTAPADSAEPASVESGADEELEAEPEMTVADELPEATPERVAIVETPAPDARQQFAALAQTDAFDEFFRYAMSQSATDPFPDPRVSSLLVAPGSLDGSRRECGPERSAVVIDLDPEGALFSSDQTAPGDSGLADLLATLRENKVDIAWISGRSAEEAGSIRRALARSGIDPLGTDTLLLMRYPDDRKQTRRQEYGETHCILAIAGDSREDFDELYAYLKDPSAAKALEALVGDGWFLTPNAIAQPASQ